MTVVQIVDGEGNVNVYGYDLPPLKAIKACVIQEVMGIRNFVGKEIDVQIIEAKGSYCYPFGDNCGVWVRK